MLHACRGSGRMTSLSENEALRLGGAEPLQEEGEEDEVSLHTEAPPGEAMSIFPGRSIGLKGHRLLQWR